MNQQTNLRFYRVTPPDREGRYVVASTQAEAVYIARAFYGQHNITDGSTAYPCLACDVEANGGRFAVFYTDNWQDMVRNGNPDPTKSPDGEPVFNRLSEHWDFPNQPTGQA